MGTEEIRFYLADHKQDWQPYLLMPNPLNVRTYTMIYIACSVLLTSQEVLEGVCTRGSVLRNLQKKLQVLVSTIIANERRGMH